MTRELLENRKYTGIKNKKQDDGNILLTGWNKQIRIHCYIIKCSRIGKGFISTLIPSDSFHYIFISNAISFQAKLLLQRTSQSYEIISVNDIFFLKLRNRLIPRYRVMTDSEKYKIKRKYGDMHKFPKLLVDRDPVAKYYNFKVGDVVSVNRNDSGEFYRICVHSNSVT